MRRTLMRRYTAFPQEVIDMIIDHLRDSQHTLYRCALTCRAWLPRSRYNLLCYATLTILSHGQLQLLAKHFSEEPTLPCFKSPYILRLGNDGLYSRGYLSKYVPYHHMATTSFVYMVPVLLSQVVSRVKVLEMSFLYWSSHPVHSGLLSQTSCFRSVTSLTLTHCSFCYFSECRQLLRSLPKLSHLSMVDVSWDRTGSAPNGHQSMRPSLISLQIGPGMKIDATRTLLEWLVANGCLQSLQEFHFTTDSVDAAIIQPFFSSCRCSLLTLVLIIGGHESSSIDHYMCLYTIFSFLSFLLY
ncbi:hypothetical protein B0H21DRAFT_721346 [Amylocystis lapponica]|nr:hypothetical protein B0H21DRAFT_721346 [Amylocystis lapponica]